MKPTEPYAGPFPRKRHSHHCHGCAAKHGSRRTACYKAHCAKASVVDTCASCRPTRTLITRHTGNPLVP
jgi:hypothetical protein